MSEMQESVTELSEFSCEIEEDAHSCETKRALAQLE